jgi:hypothetical protein
MGTRLFHLTLRQSFHNQLCQNGYWFQYHVEGPDTEPDITVASLIGDLFHTFILPKIQDFANQQVQYNGIVVSTIVPYQGAIFEQVLETSNGVQPNDALPTFNAAVLSLRSGLGGRSHRGRSFYAGVSEDDSANSRLLPDSFARLATIGVGLLATFGPTGSAAPIRYGIFSKLKGATGDPTNPWNPVTGFTGITQCAPRLDIGTCRHRKIGHGT